MAGMSASTRSAPMPQRRSSGSWTPGQSGNPRGRPPAPVDIAALAREHGPRCIAVAAELLGHDDARIRLGALVALLDRGFGKPRQTIETNDPRSPSGLHLLAARLIGDEIVAALEERNNTINAEPTQDLLNLPPPLE
jgi:hypothetical protein